MKNTLLLVAILLLSAVPQNSFAAAQCRRTLLVESETHEDVFTSGDGYTIAYQLTGNAKARRVVIFLNGIDRDMTEWDKVQAELQALHPENLYLRLDFLGQGKTAELNTVVSGEIPYQAQVATLEALLQARGLGKRELTLIGHSYGGGIAARFNADHPGRVTDLVLLAPFVDHLETYQAGSGHALLGFRIWLESMGQGQLYRRYLDGGTSLWMTFSWPLYSMLSGTRAKASNVIAMTKGMTTLQMTESVRRAGSAKVHLVTSDRDFIIPAAAHHELWDAVPEEQRGIRRVIRAAHEMVMDVPKTVIETLREILILPGSESLPRESLRKPTENSVDASLDLVSY